MKRSVHFLTALVVAGVQFWSLQVRAADNSIESVSATRRGSQVILQIAVKEPLTQAPLSFTTSSPPRIAFDFPNATNSTGSQVHEIGLGDVQSASVVQAGDRTRVVIKLRQPLNYVTAVEGKTLVVKIDGAPQIAASPPPRPASGTPRQTLRDLDFRRGSSGEGRIVVDLSGSGAAIDVKQQGQKLVVDFLHANLPDVLRRRLDVSDFGTPVVGVTTVQQGDDVRMTIEPRGRWEHSVYQSDRQFVVEVKPARDGGDRAAQEGRFRGEKLSLNFQNVEVRAVLQVIADFTGLNVVTSDTVTGSLTLRLKDVPWDQALDIVLQARGLDMRRNGNVLWIAPKDELLTKEKLELEQRSQIAELEPVRTETFELNYHKAEAFKGILDNAGGGRNTSILSKRGSAVIDARSNQVFVTDVPSKLEEIRRLVQKIDVASRQVLIEARIVEANDSFSRNLGARLAFAGTSNSGSGNGGYALGGSLLNSSAGSPLPGINSNAVNLPAQGINGASPGSVALTLFNASATRIIGLELSALEADGKGKVLSSPRVITADKLKAIIEQGTELPYQTATSSGATSLAFRKANLKLEVTPQITPDGNVILDVDVNKDSVGQATLQGFAIDTKHVKTQVLIDNGGTVVIGGIYVQDERTNESKVPLLGDLPVLGHLFKSTSKVNNRTELLIFLTPRVLNDKLAVR